MKGNIDAIRLQFDQEQKSVASSNELEQFKIKYVGRKGLVQGLMDELRQVPKDKKPELGKIINDLKCHIDESIEQLGRVLIEREEKTRLAAEKIDITLPGLRGHMGTKHPVMAMLDEIVDIFCAMGFSVQTSPEIDTDYYNFEVLNFHPDHPARDMQDTFYIDPKMLLRTHTTSFQGRLLESSEPPIRALCPGRCYRNETVSSRSHVSFHQVDFIYVDKHVSLADLFGTLNQFLERFFKREVATRFRPSFFPFVEPGVEVDIDCALCKGKGCSLCKHSGWLEILGAGMVHPQVIRSAGLDPEKYRGFAAGIGVERLVLRRYAANDIRLFFENDMRFLKQFAMV